MAGLPPPPVNDQPGSFAWLEWYRQLRNYVSTSGSVPWYIINFSGSNITDIAQRSHENLQALQGGSAGQHYHLTAAQHASLGAGNHNSLLSIQGGSASERYHLTTEQHSRATSVLSLSSDPTTAQIAASQWAIYKNTTTGNVRLWANDGGTMKSVLLS